MITPERELLMAIINNCVEKVTLTEDDYDLPFDRIGVDSFTFIRIIVEIESKFNCEIPDSRLIISELDTIRKIYSLLQELNVEEK